VHVISRKRLLEAERRHSGIGMALDAWYRAAKSARWRSLQDVRQTYSSADGVRVGGKVLTVFNIGGNDFRLIVGINYETQRIFVKHVLTHAEYDKRGLEEMSALAEIVDEKEYAALLASTLPHVIHTEQENERCIAALEALDSREKLSVEERRIAELLTLLIENFEDKTYALPPAGPVEIIRHLMETNGLRQLDMIDVFGSAGIVSEVLSGKRGLSKKHIARLSQRFHVSPELFFPPHNHQ
jgi:mRNA-degrading endonuclease HigB of HigAB toxin-antitoxin module